MPERFARLARLVLLCAVAGCSDTLDAATAIASDIQSGAEVLALSPAAASHMIVHVPRAHRGGCAGAYKVQFTADSALVVWCRQRGEILDVR